MPATITTGRPAPENKVTDVQDMQVGDDSPQRELQKA